MEQFIIQIIRKYSFFDRDKHITNISWLLSYITMIIPTINIVMSFVFLFNGKANKSLNSHLLVGFVIFVEFSTDVADIIQEVTEQIPSS